MCDGKTRNAYFLWRNVIFNTSLLFEKKLLCFNARISNKAICSFVLVNVCLNSTFHPLCKTYQSKCKILGVTFANYRIQIEHVRCLILVQIKYATCYVTGKISSDVETTGCLEKKKIAHAFFIQNSRIRIGAQWNEIFAFRCRLAG